MEWTADCPRKSGWYAYMSSNGLGGLDHFDIGQGGYVYVRGSWNQYAKAYAYRTLLNISTYRAWLGPLPAPPGEVTAPVSPQCDHGPEERGCVHCIEEKQ